MSVTAEPPDADDDDATNDDAVQRLLNDAKREELERQFGGRFFHAPRSRLPPEIEGEWLAYVEDMERRLRNAVPVPLRAIVGVTVAPALADLPDSAVEPELESLLERFAQHDVLVDFPDGVEAPEAYRFIVEELLDELVLDLRAPGVRMHILYRRRGGDP
jgi:hypothetical protein